MKKDFDKVHTPESHIKTRAELLARLRVRQRPAYERNFIPSGHITTQVHKAVKASHERRIAELRESLGSAKEGLETEFALKPKEGQARADFGRSR